MTLSVGNVNKKFTAALDTGNYRWNECSKLAIERKTALPLGNAAYALRGVRYFFFHWA
jgi:hypothetical protein